MIGELTGMLAVLGVFLFPTVMVVLIIFFKTRTARRRNELQAEIYDKVIEKGMELPANFFAPIEKKKNPFNTGIICMVSGLGTSLFFVVMGIFNNFQQEELWGASGLGAIPFMVGVGYLIIFFVEKKHQREEK
jgi:hypothetical protein